MSTTLLQPCVPLQHTLGHVDCPACDALERAAPVVRELTEQGRQPFARAWREWLDGRQRITASTRETYRQYFAPLDRAFGKRPLAEITYQDVVAYRERRRREILAVRRKRGQAETPTAGASRINHEIAALGRVLARAGLWEPIRRQYEPLPLPREGPGMALTAEEERHLLEVARSRPRWLVAYCCELITLGTTAGPKEIRQLRVRDVDLARRALRIEDRERETTKNEFRVRALPLGDDALWAVEHLLERYRKAMRKAGIAPDPDHFILYHRAHRRGAPPDPTRPMGSWKRAHASLRAEAAKRYPRLARVRHYDLRHTGATKLLEDPEVSYSTVERIMGHRLGSRTKQRYEHIRDATLRAAAAKLDAGHTRQDAGSGRRLGDVRKPPVGAVQELGAVVRKALNPKG